MITREQFEAHVRAEAEKRYDMRWNEYRHLQNAYIATRMEHEWPLVEALQKITTEVQGADVSIQRTPTNPRPEMKTTHRRIYVKAYRVTLDNKLVKGHYRYVPRKWSDARRTAEDKRAIKVWEGKALDIPAGGFR
jgi:hypothetical protein